MDEKKHGLSPRPYRDWKVRGQGLGLGGLPWRKGFTWQGQKNGSLQPVTMRKMQKHHFLKNHPGDLLTWVTSHCFWGKKTCPSSLRNWDHEWDDDTRKGYCQNNPQVTIPLIESQFKNLTRTNVPKQFLGKPTPEIQKDLLSCSVLTNQSCVCVLWFQHI